MPPSGRGKAGEWAFYDNGNELSGGEIAQVNGATYRLVDGQKIPHRRVWLVFPKGNGEYLEKSARRAPPRWMCTNFGKPPPAIR